MLGVAVFGHSGEFGPSRTDLTLPGRGIDFAFVRSYRSSLADQVGELGRGWSANIAKRVEAVEDDLLVHDGAGLIHRFAREGTGFTSPAGYYGVITEERRGVILRHRYGVITRFDVPARGGRIRSVGDRNGNVIRFTYRSDRIEVLDTLGRRIDITLVKDRIQEVRDHAGRTWNYGYDGHDRLIEVIQPATPSDPAGSTLRFGYDDQHQLVSLTDAKGQTWLDVRYDDAGRVVEQTHGAGIYTFAYESIGQDLSTGVRVTCGLKNGGTLVVDHDPAGHPVSRTLFVRRNAFDAEDVAGVVGQVVPIVSTSTYNREDELVSRTEPAGDSIAWVFSEDDDDPRNRGNCLSRTATPAPGAPADQTSLVTSYEYDGTFQFPAAVTDPRGNTIRHRYDERGNRVATTHPPVTIQPVSPTAPRPTPIVRTVETKFDYNSRGQLLRTTNIDGSVETYDYYPVIDSIGARSPSTATSDPSAECGYLARITREVGDQRIRLEYGYDPFGNISRVLDGKGNTSQLQYDALGRLERIIGREPVGSTIRFRYDANGNQVESAQSFEHFVQDEATGAIVERISTIRELFEYDVLDRLVARMIAGDDRKITERWGRDAAGRIIRQVQPSGNTTEYEYDERDLLITKTFAAGTKESFTHRYAWTLNGMVRARTDGNGYTYTNRFDGFHRFLGFSDPLGTSKTQSLDAAGNVVRVAIEGANATTDGSGRRRARTTTFPLMEAAYHIDEWNRAWRIDRAWRGPDGRSLGSSGWAEGPGVVSMLIEYAEDGLPGAIWSESGNVTTVKRDAAGRIATVGDLTGETWSVDWDDNGNPTSIDYRQAPESTDLGWTLDLTYDELDRLVRQQASDDAPRRFRYNAIGAVTGHVTGSGLEVRQLHDALGRRVGHAYSVQGVMDGETQAIVRGFEFDDTFRLVSSSDAAGNRTTYRYDALDRQVGVVYADGTAAQAEYDANGNVVRVVDQNGTETVNRFDASNRLVERPHRLAGASETVVEQFEYDPVGRLVAANGPGESIARTFDSLSRPLTERQGRRTVHFETDAAGNLTTIRYPGGEVVRRRHDVRQRVTAIETAAGEVVGDVRYGPNDSVGELTLGGIIRVACDYDARLRLASIEYRTVADGTLVDGFRYAYDGDGRVAHEIQLRDGPASGNRFTFDAANRPVLAQYGVRDVRDPASQFELETRYEYFPEWRWRRRIDRDGRGKVLDDRTGTLDQRNRYLRFGDVSFTHDAAGNVTRRGTDNPGFCLYTYDADNRLVKTECFDKTLVRTQLIEYVYDALGRLVRKVVTDGADNSSETTYVWAGTVLLEEYENGVLVRTYVYGLATRPARLTVDKDGSRTDYVYVHDGRGQASGLVVGTDPNAFAERYGYEITGASFMKEIDGLPVDFPSRSTARSSFLNAVLSDNGLGGLRDWETGTLAGFGGTHIPQDIAEILNSLSALTGKARKGIVGTLNDQMTGYLGWLGLGSSRMPTTSGPGGSAGSRQRDTMNSVTGSSSGTKTLGASEAFVGAGVDIFGFGAGDTLVSEMSFPFRVKGSKSNAPDMPFKPDWSLYAAGDGTDGGTGTGTGGGTGGGSGTGGTGSGSGTGGTGGGSGTGGTGGGSGTGGTGGSTGGTGGSSGGSGLIPSGTNEKPAWVPSGTSGVGGSGGSTGNLMDKVKDTLKNLPVTGGSTKGGGYWGGVQGTFYTDPDQAGSGVIVVRPEQIDMKLNGRKRPMNPNGGVGGDEPIDGSTPPPGAGGIDPTQALYDPDAMVFVASSDVPPKVSTAPIDYAQGYGPGGAGPFTGDSGGEYEHDTGVP
jgi:YD repeat-containing protein